MVPGDSKRAFKAWLSALSRGLLAFAFGLSLFGPGPLWSQNFSGPKAASSGDRRYHPAFLEIKKIRDEIDKLEKEGLLVSEELPFFGGPEEEPGTLRVAREADLKPRRVSLVYPHRDEIRYEARQYYDEDGLLRYAEVNKRGRDKILASKFFWFDSSGALIREETRPAEKGEPFPGDFRAEAALYLDTKSLDTLLVRR